MKNNDAILINGIRKCETSLSHFKSSYQCFLLSNSYEYGIHIHMSSGLLKKPVEIVLKATHNFGNFTQRLHNLDRVWFRGTLKTALSNISELKHRHSTSHVPFIEITSIGCMQCEDKKLDAVILGEGLKISARLRDLSRGVKYLLNVLFNPLVTFK